MACGPALTPAEDLAAREADATPRLLLRQVRVLMQQEDETTTLDALLRSSLAAEGGTDFRQEVFGKLRTKGRQRAGHGGRPSRKGKKRAIDLLPVVRHPREP